MEWWPILNVRHQRQSINGLNTNNLSHAHLSRNTITLQGESDCCTYYNLQAQLKFVWQNVDLISSFLNMKNSNMEAYCNEFQK